LDDGGCLKASLPMDFFPLTSTHFALGMKFRVSVSTLGIAVISGSFPRYWIDGNTSMSLIRWILQVFDGKTTYSHLLECTRYLGFHFHYWWTPSRLLTVYINDR